MASPQDILTSFLATSAPGAHIAHLQGPHGCGKSTQWLCRIWDQIAREPTATLVYIQPTKTQVQLLTAYLSTQSIKDGLDNGRVMLFSMQEMASLSRHAPQWQAFRTRLGPRATVCIDIEVTPSARGEYLVALFHNRAAAATHAGKSLAVITMGAAGHRYPSLARPVIIQVEPPHELSPMKTLTSRVHATSVIWETFYEGGKAQDRNILLFTDSHTAAGLTNSSSWYNYERRTMGLPACQFITLSRPQFDKDPALVVSSLATLKGPSIIQVDHDIEVRFPIRNVAMAVYQGTKEMTVLDNRTGLMVKHTSIPVSKQELLGKQGLATYSCGPTKLVHYSLDGPISMDSIPDKPRPHAHSSELLGFCLLALNIPAYNPLAYNICPLLWHEALRVVKLMGLVDQNTSRLTRVGHLTLHYAHRMSWSMSNIYPAAFIAHMQHIPASPATKRVACMMAAILQAGQNSIWHPEASEQTYSAHQFIRALIAQGSPSFDLDRLWSGSLWVAVALLEEVIHTSKAFTTPSEDDRWPLKNGCSFNHAAMIYSLSNSLAQTTNSPGPLDMVDPGDQPDILHIQRAMLSAYAQNVMFIPSVDPSAPQRNLCSLSSLQPLEPNLSDMTSLRPYVANNRSGSLGLFTMVELVEQEAKYIIHGTMPLHCEAFDVFHGRIPGFHAGAKLDADDLNKLITGLMTVWGREVMMA